MKKNYFYTTLQEEFSLLLKAARARSSSEIEALERTCFHRHKTLCIHLLRDFITPVAREDIYAVSQAIFSVFSTLSALSEPDRSRAEKSVLLLSTDPFRMDETPLRRREDLWDLWADSSRRTSSGERCFFALDLLAERLLLTAIRNA